MKERRSKKKEEKKKRGILANFIAVALSLFFLIFIVYFIDPQTFLIVPVFFLTFFVFIFFLLGILIKETRRNLIISITILVFFIMRYFKIGNFVNFFLLIAILVTILIYESYSQKAS